MLLALISSTFLFMVLYYVGEEWLDYYFNSSSYMVNMQKPYLESLQQYIKKNGITTKEYKKLPESVLASKDGNTGTIFCVSKNFAISKKIGIEIQPILM